MKSILSKASVAMASLALFASPAYSQASATDQSDGQPTQNPGSGLTMRTPTEVGCYSDPGNMIDMGPYTFQAMGWCQPLCIRLAKPYLAFVNGSNCLCGDNPPSGNTVDGNNCNTPCEGFPGNTCGGTNFYAVYKDGFQNGDPTGTVHINVPVQTSVSAAAESTSGVISTTLITQAGGQTVPTVIEITTTAQPANQGSTGPNKVAIGVGVVVGVVALFAIIGALFFFMRHRKNQAIAAERARMDALTARMNPEKPGSSYSLGDQRLDQSVMFQRRQSDGSIADNEDYSRRILKVTNPE